jgi:hypothetical protein
MKTANYKVRFYQNNLWEVISDVGVEFLGNLSDCHAWIQLNNDGFL